MIFAASQSPCQTQNYVQSKVKCNCTYSFVRALGPLLFCGWSTLRCTLQQRSYVLLSYLENGAAVTHGGPFVQDYRRGQELVKNRDFKANETFFKDVFEVGRRYKIMNPDRMRGTYGKLLYMLMDTADSNIEDLLEFSCIKCVPHSYTLI